MNAITKAIRDWRIGWHEGAITRHTRLLAKCDPDRERRDYAARLATSPAASRVRIVNCDGHAHTDGWLRLIGPCDQRSCRLGGPS